MIERFLISWVIENGYPHYKVYDKATDQTVHCDENELNETIWELLGVWLNMEIKNEINVNKLIETFTDMANRESLLARGGISQKDLLIQIVGTIVKVAME